mmetsp:Transcript_51716/g.83915  ORF Transcript_51716/g.83915 Transcript_51716/m.83915 type:complete len:95 (-) Transcript_51716:300-584(-)
MLLQVPAAAYHHCAESLFMFLGFPNIVSKLIRRRNFSFTHGQQLSSMRLVCLRWQFPKSVFASVSVSVCACLQLLFFLISGCTTGHARSDIALA